MPLTIRRATPADAPVIIEFNGLMARETEGEVLDRAVLAAGVAAVLSDSRKGLYFVAEEDGVLLGQLLITLEWSDWRNGWLWWIQSVYVRSDARRRGVFRTLYQHVCEAARADAEVAGLRLYVAGDNQAAQRTYLRLGMKATNYVVFQKYPL